MLKAVCAFIAGAAAMIATAAAQWHEVKTENFTVLGDADVDKLEEMAVELEQFRVFLGIIHAGKLMPPEPVNVPVYILKDERSYLEIYDNEHSGGVYTNRIETPIFIVNAERDGTNSLVRGQRRDRTRQSRHFLKHEYVHHFLYINGPDYYPMWYSEGMADYYSSFTYQGGIAQVGELISMRASWLMYDDLLDWDRVFLSKNYWRRDEDNGPLTTRDVSRLYAQSWLATQYLMSDQDRRARLVDYLQRIQVDTENYPEKFNEAFGVGMEEMGEEIERYLSRNQLVVMSYNLSDYEVSASPRSRRLDDWEEEMAVLYAKRFFADDDAVADIRDRLTALSAQRPEAVRPLVELGFLERDAGNGDAAERHAARAYALAPDDSMVLTLKALTGPYRDRAQMLESAREADPANALAHYEYALRYQSSPSEAVLDAAIDAMYGSAENETLPLLVGKLLIDLEYYDDARALLVPISVWGKTRSMRRAAEIQLERIPAT